MPIAHHIRLEESTHTYRDYNGKAYKSVSTLIAKYKTPFDKEAIAAKTAARQGLTVEQVLAEWAKAAPYGTAVHKQMEDFFFGADGPIDLIEPYLPKLNQWRSQDVEFYPETILYHPDAEIAGTADMLVKRGDSWTILDWKTNKAIRKKGYKGKKMLYPFDHLDDCNHVHYSLQLSLYALMLGEPVKNMNLVHIPRHQETLEVIPCLDLRQEAQGIINAQMVETVGLPF